MLTITVRLAALFTCIAQVSLFAAPAWPNMPAEPPRETVLGLDAEEVGVIIEFAAPALVDVRVKRDVAAARATLDAYAERLRADLARIERTGPSDGTERMTADRELRHQYRVTFAGASARVRRESLPALRALPYVRAVHMDREMEALVAETVPHIGAPQVWETYGRKGRGIVIAVIDTGIDYRHWALGKGFGPGFKVIGGYDFYNDDADPIDDHGHGTHVAGIAAGTTAPVLGVAPEASLLAYKVLDHQGRGEASTVIAGIERAVDPNGDGDPSDRADVVNMSLGGPLEWNDPAVAAVERGVAAGAVFVLAAGNRFDHGTLGSPAVAESAITVGALDLNDLRYGFSSRGPVGGKWLVKPDIGAPGMAVSSVLDGGTLRAAGTSMAAPHVAGVAALLLEQHRHWTPADVKAAMVSTAKPVYVADAENGGKPTELVGILHAGGGRVNALRAIEAKVLPSPSTVSFGIAARRGQPYTSTVMVAFTNRGGTAETLTVKLPRLPAGVTMTAAPETLTLAAGERGEVKVTLSLGADAPGPIEEKVVISGMLELTGTTTSLHVPWMVVNGDTISVTYPGTEPFLPYVSRGGGAAQVWPEGPRAFGAFALRTLSVDVLIYARDERSDAQRLLIRERVRVDGPTPITILPEDAKHRIDLVAVDESGAPLESLTDSESIVSQRIRMPSLSEVELRFPPGTRSLFVTPLERTQIRTFEKVTGRSSLHFAAYRTLIGMRQDERLTLDASDWGSQKLRILSPPAAEVFIGAGGGSPMAWRYAPLTKGMELWTVHVTPRVDEYIDFRVHLLVQEKGAVFDRRSNPFVYVSPSLRHREGRLALSPFNRSTIADYIAPSRDAIVPLGDGPVALRMSMGRTVLQFDPYGTVGEIYGDAAKQMRVKLEALDGKPPRLINDLWITQWELRAEPGRYRLTATQPYTVDGRPGKVSLLSLFDTRVFHAPPSLSTLRIEDGAGTITSRVPAGSLPRLVFAARTSARPDDWNGVEHMRVDPAKTRVWWRRGGTAEWTPLPVAMTGEEYVHADDPGSPGTMFVTPLAAAAAAEGAIDLKIEVVNEYGFTTENVYEPAFFVDPAPARRRAVRP